MTADRSSFEYTATGILGDQRFSMLQNELHLRVKAAGLMFFGYQSTRHTVISSHGHVVTRSTRHRSTHHRRVFFTVISSRSIKGNLATSLPYLDQYPALSRTMERGVGGSEGMIEGIKPSTCKCKEV